ncbi:hypothetical protein L915_00655 [Phytophthora nicotianae]|uniref:Uncharacterized protein n=1 Tax=Phytophthora nicotianae TaxID=4792 RepID=W2P5Y9_PHYNI|nr:hypothetical protein L915_00655 [Phytophthora nicotianae]ETM56372.1 hypothetical protein L914_00646 [Phytophthora nicotianae]
MCSSRKIKDLPDAEHKDGHILVLLRFMRYKY